MAAVGGFFYLAKCKCLVLISVILVAQIALRVAEKMKVVDEIPL
ncbi:hypothetical protein SAMN02745131_03403 [Flavisolibacter ginsengisoli DSM 18119]|uniref:Uncharacterized protein n=1 Tax=Flavisolibacter ginsengisoli DSM 18119 TaxID=1121884 RepID=A0A1M5E345_9BACT|nr:hypothetical protein SAMN02745131_03403 [Flavisolibacter ginsengisoli DSM 18119]